MKKIIGLLLCVFMLTACFPTSGMKEVSAEDAATAIENKESMILLIGKEECPACKEFEKVTDEFLKNYDVRITEVYLDKEEEVTVDGKVTQPTVDKLEEYVGVIGGTPSVYFIQDGVIKGAITGSLPYANFVERVKKYGFISEE